MYIYIYIFSRNKSDKGPNEMTSDLQQLDEWLRLAEDVLKKKHKFKKYTTNDFKGIGHPT